MTRSSVFGSELAQINHYYPSRKELEDMPLEKQIKLFKITYKVYRKTKKNTSVKAIQFHFTGGVKSKLYEGT